MQNLRVLGPVQGRPSRGSRSALRATVFLLPIAYFLMPTVQAESPHEKAMLDNLERRAREALAAIPRARTAEETGQRRDGLRQQLERSLGMDRFPKPEARGAKPVGSLARPGYRIEKIVYETLPGAIVPAHLYVPAILDRPAPGVLFYPGHWWTDSKSRPDFQAFCINMARLGFVVLSFDPFGQGERGVSSRDHRRTEALLVGVSQQGFAEFETRCALAYLLARKEVDPQRVGITGASGGGYNTWITAALDERIRAAVPVVGTSEFAEQIQVCRPLDWYHAAEHCHFVPNLIRFGNNHELLAMAAPKPILIVAAAHDQSFPLAGVREVHSYGRSLYDSYRSGEKFGLCVDETEGHGYQTKKREAAYGWFLRWLLDRGDGRPYPEPATETTPADAEELRCFQNGQNQPAGPAMIAFVEQLARGLPPASPNLHVEPVIGALPDPPANRAKVGTERLERLLVPSERDWNVPVSFLWPAGDVRGLLVALDDRGKDRLATDPLIQDLRAQRWAICGVDPRGVGESATDKMGWVFAVSLMLGENFVGRQAWDLSRVMDDLSADAAPASRSASMRAGTVPRWRQRTQSP
jgi:dienelactone hydrolase